MCLRNMGMENKPKEECGVFGIYDKSGKDCARTIYYALYALQHRGQESCGMAVNDDNHIFCHKDLGLGADVFSDFVIPRSKGILELATRAIPRQGKIPGKTHSLWRANMSKVR